MTEINSELIKFNGKIGPQYLDVEDKSGGLDGTMKPITKEVLQEMYVSNFPDVQSVKDADVKSELEMIKQTQADVLGRLNDGVDTRVTGSSVEEVYVQDNNTIDLLPGETYRVLDHQPVKSPFVYFGIRRLQSTDISISARASFYPSGAFLIFPKISIIEDGTRGMFVGMEAHTRNFTLQITNKTDEVLELDSMFVIGRQENLIQTAGGGD